MEYIWELSIFRTAHLPEKIGKKRMACCAKLSFYDQGEQLNSSEETD